MKNELKCEKSYRNLFLKILYLSDILAIFKLVLYGEGEHLARIYTYFLGTRYIKNTPFRGKTALALKKSDRE